MTLAQVSDDLASGLARRIQPTFGYYRQPNGWITISPNTRLERLKYTEQGWKYLDAYGTFDMTTYTANHPLEGLFMFGGAKELSVEQILESGLYIDPPLVPTCKQHLTQLHRSHTRDCWRGAKRAEFLQLAGVSPELIGPFVCDFCKRKMPTVQAREQHQSVAHSKPLGNIQMGRSLGDSLAEALGNSRPSQVNPVATGPTVDQEALLARIADLEARLVAAPPLRKARGMETCGCGSVYKVRGRLEHQLRLKHQKWAADHSPVAI